MRTVLREQYPKAAELLEAAAEDVLAFMQAPPERCWWSKTTRRLPPHTATSVPSPWGSWNRDQRRVGVTAGVVNNSVHRDGRNYTC